MTNKEKDDCFYVCSLIEYLGRKTKNRRGSIVDTIGADGINKLLKDAEVDHCLSFEQVSDEVAEEYGIKTGDFDTISGCRYSVPDHKDIGRLYSYMIEGLAGEDNVAETLTAVFRSFISDEISRFSTALYCENLSYLCESYKRDTCWSDRYRQ